jgi:hypothetical protein
MRKIIFSVTALFSVFAFNVFGQACVNSEATISIENGLRVDNNVFVFDVAIRNSGASSLVFSAFGGGLFGIPEGVEGFFEVIEQPAKKGLSLNQLDASLMKRNAPIMRWSSIPLFRDGEILEKNRVKFAKFRFVRTGGESLPKTILLKWKDAGIFAPQVVTYCEGNDYAVTLTFANGGLKTEDLTIYSTGISATTENNSGFININPNPAIEKFTLDVSNLVSREGEINLEMLDVAGKVVMSRVLAKNESEHTILLHGLISSTYLVKVSQNGKVYTKKLIKVQ